MKKLFIIIKRAIIALLASIRIVKKAKKAYSQTPIKLAKALKGLHPIRVVQREKNLYQVVFKGGISHVYRVNARKSVATMLF